MFSGELAIYFICREIPLAMRERGRDIETSWGEMGKQFYKIKDKLESMYKAG